MKKTSITNNNHIELKSIASLSGMHFFIPDYQRGYRWGTTQATQMMKDFKAFAEKKSKNDGEFYCLQPIVVKPAKWIDTTGTSVEGYEVIDGQQRLTTLYILLKAITENKWKEDHPKFELFDLTYETRLEVGSDEFLKNIDKSSNSDTNYVDFYYMKMVFDTISKWFTDNGMKSKITDALLDHEIDSNTGKDKANNVRVIWYEVESAANSYDDKSESIDIFTRLNIGKIPLTNAELIKALLLQKNNFGDASNLTVEIKGAKEKEIELRQIQIATEWNILEQKLQNEAFWYFIYNETNEVKYETRIEYIFDLMSNKYENSTEDKADYYTFEYFNAEFESCEKEHAAEIIWNRIKEYFRNMEYWYDDRQLFHLIGFLINQGEKLTDLVSLYKGEKQLNADGTLKTKEDGESIAEPTEDNPTSTLPQPKSKTEFLKLIRELVASKVKGIDLDEITYKKNARDISTVLLLFNILTVLDSDRSDLKFPFEKYKTENWDREHIASQTDQEFPDDFNKRKYWINDMIFFFTGVTTPKDATDEDRDNIFIRSAEDTISNLKAAATLDTVDKKKLYFLEAIADLKKKSLSVSKDTKDEQKTEYLNSFKTIYNEISKEFGEDHVKEDDKDFISNMALLNATINRSYGNAFFAIKRQFIKTNDSQGVFVPIATKNVFMKYYSDRVDNMMCWTPEDAKAYGKAIKDKIKTICQ